jgi:hypothetical protein
MPSLGWIIATPCSRSPNDVAMVHMHKRRGCRHAWFGNDPARGQIQGRKGAFPAAAVRPVSPHY